MDQVGQQDFYTSFSDTQFYDNNDPCKILLKDSVMSENSSLKIIKWKGAGGLKIFYVQIQRQKKKLNSTCV